MTLQATLFYENLLVLFTFCCPPRVEDVRPVQFFDLSGCFSSEAA